jgi:hypothetical protein
MPTAQPFKDYVSRLIELRGTSLGRLIPLRNDKAASVINLNVSNSSKIGRDENFIDTPHRSEEVYPWSRIA